MKTPTVIASVVAVGVCSMVALGGCAALEGSTARDPDATAPSGNASASSGDPGTLAPSGGGAASPSAQAATPAPGSPSPTGAGPSSPGPGETGPALDCGNVFVEAWPVDMARPAAAGWDGPSCAADGGGVVLTWAFAGGAPAPEVTDAAFVALRKGFADEGWTEEETGGEDRNGEVVTALQMESPGGRPGTISYVSGGDDPAELSVRFEG